MRIAVPHNTTRARARKIVEDRLENMQQQYGHYAEDLDHNWQGDTLHFAFKAKGINGKGTVEITDTDVIIDGKLPLIAKPFESRIRSTVEREAQSMFSA
ncbi:MAG TPA: polyhydroxyalkanoic acid system family protein [Thermoanaerobaculia bacterium]